MSFLLLTTLVVVQFRVQAALPEKSFWRYRFGYAAGYEARLCRAVQIDLGVGCALGSGFARCLLAKGRTMGVAQTQRELLTARQSRASHAAAKPQQRPKLTFSGKVSSSFSLPAR